MRDFKKYRTYKFDEIVNSIKIPTKIQKKQYLLSGQLPIISQEDGFINGYWNDEKDKITVKKPVIVWGDHTRVIKYVDKDFVAGADGTKVFLPKDNIYTRWLYYWMNANPVESLGYARHYRILKDKKIIVPSIEEQKKIVSKLDAEFEKISRTEKLLKENLENVDKLQKTILSEAFKFDTDTHTD